MIHLSRAKTNQRPFQFGVMGNLIVEDAREQRGIPVIGLANSDCDIELVSYPMLGNDASIASITFFVNEIAGAYREGREGA